LENEIFIVYILRCMPSGICPCRRLCAHKSN